MLYSHTSTYTISETRRPYPCLSFSTTNGCGSYHAAVVCVASSEAASSAWSTDHNEVRPSADDLDGCADGYAAHLGAVDHFAHHRRVLLVLELRAGLTVASEVQPVLLIAAEPSRDGVVEEFAGSDEQSENHGVCVEEGRDRSPCFSREGFDSCERSRSIASKRTITGPWRHTVEGANYSCEPFFSHEIRGSTHTNVCGAATFPKV